MVSYVEEIFYRQHQVERPLTKSQQMPTLALVPSFKRTSSHRGKFQEFKSRTPTAIYSPKAISFEYKQIHTDNSEVELR